MAWSGAARFTMCYLGLPATCLEPNTLYRHIGAMEEISLAATAAFLGRAKSFPRTCRQNLVLEKRAMAPEECGRMNMYAFMARMDRNNTCLAAGSTGGHVQRHAGTYDGSHSSPGLRATARSLEFAPSLQGVGCSSATNSAAGPLPRAQPQPSWTGLASAQRCPRSRAMFAPLLLLVATTSPPKHPNSSGLA